MLSKFRRNHRKEKTQNMVSVRLLKLYALGAYGLTFLTIIGFACHDYESYLKNKRLEMEAAGYEIEMNFTSTLGYAESVLNYINSQVSVSKAGKAEVAKILSSFNQSHYGYNSIKDVLSVVMFYWIDSDKRLVASGISPLSPADVSGQGYLLNTKKDPRKIYTGMPVVGAASGQYVIPAGVGVVNIKNQYIGTSIVSFKLYNLAEKFKRLVGYYKVDFAILDLNNKVLMESETGLFSEDRELLSDLSFPGNFLREGLVSSFSPLKQKGSYVVVRNVQNYPYKILVSYQNSFLTGEILFGLMPRLIELLVITVFFSGMVALLRLVERK
jgi:hypothetical protein